MGIYRLLVTWSQASILDWDSGYLQVTGTSVTVASILDWDGGYLQVTGNLVTGLYSRLGRWVFTGYWYLGHWPLF